jgi:dienelactone hydrolase
LQSIANYGCSVARRRLTAHFEGTVVRATQHSAREHSGSARGDADPVAPFNQLAAFREEVRRAQTNWEVNIYGDARHRFTGEGVLDQSRPEPEFHPQSEARSSRATVKFLKEVLT